MREGCHKHMPPEAANSEEYRVLWRHMRRNASDALLERGGSLSSPSINVAVGRCCNSPDCPGRAERDENVHRWLLGTHRSFHRVLILARLHAHSLINHPATTKTSPIIMPTFIPVNLYLISPLADHFYLRIAHVIIKSRAHISILTSSTCSKITRFN